MKNFIVISLAGMLCEFLKIAFEKNNINSSTWHEETRGMFIFFCVGWIAIAAVFAEGMNHLKTSNNENSKNI